MGVKEKRIIKELAKMVIINRWKNPYQSEYIPP